MEKTELKDPYRAHRRRSNKVDPSLCLQFVPLTGFDAFPALCVMLNHFKVIKGGRIPSPVESLYRKKRRQIVIVLPPPPSSLHSPLSPFSFPPFILLPFITPQFQTCLKKGWVGGWLAGWLGERGVAVAESGFYLATTVAAQRHQSFFFVMAIKAVIKLTGRGLHSKEVQ